MAKATTIRAQCRFCGLEIWAQSDNGEPECEDCGTLAVEVARDLHEVEETLHPITEWQWWEA